MIYCQVPDTGHYATAQVAECISGKDRALSAHKRTAWALALVMAKLRTKSACHRFAPLVLAVVLCVTPLSTSETCWTKLLYVEVKVPAQVLSKVSAQILSVCRVLSGAALQRLMHLMKHLMWLRRIGMSDW